MIRKAVRIITAAMMLVQLGNPVYSQAPPTNGSAAHNYVNVNMPKTPESASFEKYGIYSVNEFSGTPNISIPIYTLQSRYLEVPITLSYQPTGIRVNQEASWVGLGFDINAGGRVTVETRGSVDFCSATAGLYSTTNLKSGMQQLFHRLGTSSENAVLTFASLCENGCSYTPDPNPDLNPDNLQAIQDMTEYGAGEPDIFRANFMGHSLVFYFDKSTDNLDMKWLGEQSNFAVSKTQDANGNITGWTIKDDNGIIYYFNQAEVTTNTIPPNAIVPATTTSAWLLTRMEHPNGDYIQFTYNNYGQVLPAFTMSASAYYQASTGGTSALSSDQNQNVNVQSPYYLTRIETENVAVDFVLGTRTDLYGAGARRLNQINVTDKFSNTLKKSASFSYTYFQGSVDASSRTYLGTLTYNLPSPMVVADYLATSNSRLRLDAITISGNNSTQAPYNFYYNTVALPDKYTMSQDNWGYYNGVSNSTNGYRFTHLIPLNGQFGVQPVFTATPAFATAVGTSNLGFNRDCDPNLMQAMMLNKIVYPTGGRTEFVYEPHTSKLVNGTTNITGGGLRVKTISSYTSEGLAGTTEYAYNNGKYMGAIEYYTASNNLKSCSGQGLMGEMKLTTNGAVNFNDILIGYAQITITQKDGAGNTNGSIVKNFSISTPSSNYANGIGFDVQPAHWPAASFNSSVAYLNAAYSGFPPTPSVKLEGKIIQEQYYDKAGSLLKTTNYNYIVSNYTNNFYDVRAIENRVGGFNLSCTGSYPNSGTTDGDRPVVMYISPGKSYRSVLDNTVDISYSNGNPFTKTQYYTYNSYYQVQSKRTVNADGTSTTETYQYPIDLTSSGNQIIYSMLGKHIFSPVITTTVTNNGTALTVTTNNYYNPTTGVYVPQNVQMQVKTNTAETRYLYNYYDVYGHMQEGQKPNDTREVYLWGYHTYFPVAKIVGSTYAAASALINQAVLDAPASEAALRLELNKLRTGLPNAMITTYTYDPVYGVTSVTDPAGRSSYYHYDGMGRLSFITDLDNNVVKTFCYNYTGQATNCSFYGNQVMSQTFTRNNCATDYAGTTGTYTVPANTFMSSISVADANAQAQNDINANGQNYINTNVASGASCIPMVKSINTSTMPFTITLTNTATGAVSSFSASPNPSSVQIGQVPVGTYNITCTPNSSTSVQITINGTTLTGSTISFSNVSVSAPLNISISPASGGPCSFSANSGYSSPTNSISNNGVTTSFYIVFYPTGTMQPGSTYLVATINGSCRPTAVRTITCTASGRNWTITIYPGGQMYWQLSSSSPAVTPNTTIGTSTLTYNL